MNRAEDTELNESIREVMTARMAIIEDLTRRHNGGDKTVKMNSRSQSKYDDDGPTNYLSGMGEIPCPVCNTGKLRYLRASYNGHVHAECSIKSCVSWVE